MYRTCSVCIIRRHIEHAFLKISAEVAAVATQGDHEMEDEILIRDRAELDTLLVNVEAAVRVKKRSDFFSWVQGVFQGMIAHEVLICAVADPVTRTYNMEWMSSHPIDPQSLSALCSSSDGLVYRLLSLWENQGRRPVLINGGQDGSPAEFAIAGEIERLNLLNVAAHGVPDAEGNAASFFCFAKMLGGLGNEQANRLELATPYLHAAWMQALGEAGPHDPANRIVVREILTSREVEILNWVEQGKSNSEIAQILSISHLTVKNHVQKILRKLDVQNRAQAVAKGIALRVARQRTH